MIDKNNYIDMRDNTCESVIFVGDIHGEFGEVKNNCRLYPNTIQFYCGDIGMGFCKPGYYDTEFKEINNRAIKNNCIIIFIRGNHDNPEYFYNTVDGWDAMKYSNIWMSQDWQIVGTKLGNVLCCGGAVSVDKAYRIEGKSWWALEKIDYQPIEEVFKRFEGIDINMVATHTAPGSFPPFGNKAMDMGWMMYDDIIQACDYERGYLDELKDYIKSHYNNVLWFYGHFHKHYMHYSAQDMIAYGLGINEVKEVVFNN